jgi:hypothetical protein
MKDGPYSALPSQVPPGAAASRRVGASLVAAAAVVALAAAGFGGYRLGRRPAAATPAAPPAASAAAAAPAAPEASAAPAPFAAPPDSRRPGANALDADWRLVDDALAPFGPAGAAPSGSEQADEIVLKLATYRLNLGLNSDDQPKPSPKFEPVVVDGVAVSVPVRPFPDDTPESQHWGFEIRVPHREARHRVSFTDSAKVYVWNGAKWTLQK